MALDPKTAKIEDVARAAGVSTMSVSRALRGVEGVSETTRARIQSIADDMGYVPSRLAGSLAQATSNLVAISVPTLGEAVFAEIIGGMRETLLHAGLETILETSDYNSEREAAWVERMITWSPAALVVAGVDHAPGVRERLRDARLPVMELWDTTDDPIDLNVGFDHHGVGRDMGRHLLQLGYRRPAYIGSVAGLDRRAEKRLDGLVSAFAEQGHTLGVMRSNKPAFEAGYEGTEQALALDPMPDVLCYLHDHFAVGGLMRCQAEGIAVPQDIGIVGFNGLGITNVLPRGLTTSVTARSLMGKTAARMLVAAIRGVRTKPRVVIPVPIEPGGTTCPQLT